MLLGGSLFAVGLIVALGGGLGQGPSWLVDHAVLVALPVIVGALLMCLRRSVLLDRRQRLATTGWSLLVPLNRSEHLLSDAHEVVLSREEQSFGDTDYDVFPVTLQGAGGDEIKLREPRDYESARRLAEEVAKFLGLGMRDRSSGEVIARAPGTLDQSLRQRAKQAGARSRMPERPAGAKSIASFDGATATIEIPPFMRWIWSVLTGLLVAALTALGLEFDTKRDAAPELQHGLFLFLVLLAVTVPILFFLMHRMGIHHRDRLVVSAHEVVLTRRGLFGARTLRLPADEIEEVVTESASGGSQRVVIRGDRGSIKLAVVHSEEEAKWLRDLLVYVLTAS
jgi:hypothetical protein